MRLDDGVLVTFARSDLSAVPVKSPVTLPVICPVTPRVPPIVVACATLRVPSVVMLPLLDRIVVLTPPLPPTIKLPPTFSLLATEIPPAVYSAAEVLLYPVESEDFKIRTIPLTLVVELELLIAIEVPLRVVVPVALNTDAVVVPTISSDPAISVLPDTELTLNLLVLIARLPPSSKEDWRLAVEVAVNPATVVA